MRSETDSSRPERPRFERLRDNGGEANPIAAALLDPEVETSGVIDSAKAFIGPAGTFYDDRWRWMDWRGHAHSWNGAAALSFGVWLAYRRMYGLAAAHAGCVAALIPLAALGAPPGLLLLLLAGLGLSLGVYGNTLYLRHFRRIARDKARLHDDYRERVAALAEAGGVDPRAAWIMAGAQLLLAILIASLADFGQPTP